MEEQHKENGLKVYRRVVPRSEVEARITEELKKLRKSVQLPGFRPGKVPLSLLRKMSGEKVEAEIIQEEVGRLQRERFAQPDGPDVLLPWSLEKSEMTEEGLEIVFVEVPTPEAPLKVDVASLLPRMEIEMTDEDVDREVEEIRKNHLMLHPLEALMETTEHPQRFMAEVEELDEDGTPLEGGIRHSAIFMWEDLPEGLQKELVGKKKGESLITALRAHFEGKEEELATVLEQDIHAIQDMSSKTALRNIVPYMIVLPEVDEAFIKRVYPDLEEPTEEAFRERARLNAETYWNRRARRHWESEVMDKLLENYAPPLPREGIRAWYAVTFPHLDTVDKLLNEQEWRQLTWGTAVRNWAMENDEKLNEELVQRLAQTYAYREAMEARKAPTNEFLTQRMALYLYHPYYRYLLHTDGWEERFFDALAEQVATEKKTLKEFIEIWSQAQQADENGEEDITENIEEHETE